MFGARVSIPVLPVFVAGHVGYLVNRYSVDSSDGNLPNFGETSRDFGFNVGWEVDSGPACLKAQAAQPTG